VRREGSRGEIGEGSLTLIRSSSSGRLGL
jgi:hypothetical protein